MDYMSVKDAAMQFSISERRVQKLCELRRIKGAKMISGVWVIPCEASKPIDERFSTTTDSPDLITLNDLCEMLSISTATGRNWVKLGKLVPDHIDKKMPIFTYEYAQRIKEDIQSGNNAALKSRRNKKYVSGNALYNSYVSDECRSIYEIQKLLAVLDSSDIEITEDLLQAILADCALHLFAWKNNSDYCGKNDLLSLFLDNKIKDFKYSALVRDLIDNESVVRDICEKYPLLFKYDYCYEPGEDILGLIYISCKNIGNRKATGSYYTSTKVVKQLVSHLEIKSNDKVLDPCCGTGNFLLQLPDNLDFSYIFGVDIDSISVKLTRINMALKYPNTKLETIYDHISEKNYLFDEQDGGFEYIIGNPPWGYEFSEEENIQLRNDYVSAIGKNIESYDVFIEQALKHLKSGGEMSFVLPEALLNVKAHMPIRGFIKKNYSIKYLDYLGNAFDGVQCPCIILQVERTNKSLSTVGMKISDGKKEFTINTEREVSSEYFSFLMNDEEYKIIEKVFNHNNVVYLENNADFALGIVTGNNKEYISSIKTDKNEMVLKGSDISKYHINPTENYIIFKPESFQQIAPTEYYRAKEKLLYRFICNQLVFAYDNKQTLSLNSCNIVIPRIEGLEVKYILAVLNSRVAQYIFKKKFNSVKVLRSHIESIPIPKTDAKTQNDIIKKVDSLISGLDLEKATSAYDELDDKISLLFGLSEEERNIIKDSVDGENKFLV